MRDAGTNLSSLGAGTCHQPRSSLKVYNLELDQSLLNML